MDSENPSSSSPTSSFATDQPWRVQVEQWLAQAQQPSGDAVVGVRNEEYDAEAALENLSITESHPLGLLAHSSLRRSSSSSVAGSQTPQGSFGVDALGIASPDYFKPSEYSISTLSSPYLTRHRSVRWSIGIPWTTEYSNGHERTRGAQAPQERTDRTLRSGLSLQYLLGQN